MPRFVALAPEIVLGVGLAVSCVSLLRGGHRAGRMARLALLAAALGALVAALLTRNVVDEFLFLAYRIDAFSQYSKALVLGAVLLAAVAGGTKPPWHDERVGAPFFGMVAAAGAVAAASATDLVLLWLSLEAVGVAFVLTAAAEGEWSSRAAAIHDELMRWLAPSLLVMLGLVLVAALAGTTRFTDLADLAQDVQSEPAGAAGMLMVLAGLAWRAGLAPVTAARQFTARQEGSERAALGVSVWIALAAIGVRFLAVALEPWLGRMGIAVLVGLLAFGVLVPAFTLWVRATREDARRPVLLTASVAGLGLAAAAFAAWAWEASAALP